MDKNILELFGNSIKFTDVSKEIFDEYEDLLPNSVIDMWKEYGFCRAEDGYFKIINPNDYIDLIPDLYEVDEDELAVPIFATGMGDIIICDQNEYFTLIDIRHQSLEVIGKDFSSAVKSMNFPTLRQTLFSWKPYEDAVKKLGTPSYEECFGYEPLLSLGGKEKLENLRKVNLAVHLDIVSQMQNIAMW